MSFSWQLIATVRMRPCVSQHNQWKIGRFC